MWYGKEGGTEDVVVHPGTGKTDVSAGDEGMGRRGKGMGSARTQPPMCGARTAMIALAWAPGLNVTFT